MIPIPSPAPEEPQRLACQAMRCRFELLLPGDNASRLHAVGQEALAEIDALDRQLNRFSPSSEIAHINREAASRPVRVEPRLFALLVRCRQLWETTGGAFDPTLEQEGMAWVKLDPHNRTVRFLRAGLSLDLGGVGKGYALDRAREILMEHGIKQAFLHGGGSSVCTLGAPESRSAWSVGLSDPADAQKILGRANLQDQCLGVSANRRGHVIDPRSGIPAEGIRLAAVVAASAADADALSTALLVRGESGIDWPNLTDGILLVEEGSGELMRRDYRAHPAGQLWN